MGRVLADVLLLSLHRHWCDPPPLALEAACLLVYICAASAASPDCVLPCFALQYQDVASV